MMKFNQKDTSHILILNCGSSSLKYRIYKMPEEQEIVKGEAERVGIKSSEVSSITHTVGGITSHVKGKLENHEDALRKVLQLINKNTLENPDIFFDSLAHRYVHPGNYFKKTVKVTPQVIVQLKKTLSLAPIHNPVSFSLIEYCEKNFKHLSQYLVFDSSFHKTIPEEFATYAIPEKLSKKHGLYKIGFHGISHKYVMEKACEYLGVKPEQQRIISCHLGTGGASICAIKNGVSINSSMGFSPIEGLIMNTRAGDIDISLMLKSMFENDFSAEEIEKQLNNKSGILGMYHKTSDLRDIIKNITVDKQAQSVLTMYINRIKKYIGYYSLLLKKADLIIFTDTLGEKEPLVREKICEGLDFLGIRLNIKKNKIVQNSIYRISDSNTETLLLVVPTNEELMIAIEAYKEFIHDRNS